jgi:hypothetical protein
MSSATESEKYNLKNTITNATTPSHPLGAPAHPSLTPRLCNHKLHSHNNRLPAAFQPGLYRPLKKLANRAPLGLCAFGLTVFILGCIEIKVRDITQPSILVASAFSYGG